MRLSSIPIKGVLHAAAAENLARTARESCRHWRQGYAWRPETGQGPWDGLHPGHTVILRPDPELQAAGRRAGGTGKTQLAAAFAMQLWEASELDLLVWLDAGSRDRIISGYAQALTDVAVAAPPGQPEAAADRFLTWLAETGRRWLVVLDGLADAADADGLWPAGPSGEVLVTTALPDLGRADRRGGGKAGSRPRAPRPCDDQRRRVQPARGARLPVRPAQR